MQNNNNNSSNNNNYHRNEAMEECEIKNNSNEQSQLQSQSQSQSRQQGFKKIKTNVNARFEVTDNVKTNDCLFFHKKPKKNNNHTFG